MDLTETHISTDPAASGFPWYALYVSPNRERVVSQLLRDRGYEVFMPTYRRLRQWSDRRVELDWPLFPGYTFGRFDLERSFPVLKMPGVVRFVGFGNRPVALPDSEIDAVRRMAAEGSQMWPHRFLRSGRRIRVQQGPLAGVEGMLVRVKSGHRLVISIDILQRSVAAEVDIAHVRPD